VEPGSPPNNGFRVLFNNIVIFENLNAISGFGTFTFNNLQATASVTTLEFQGRNVLGFDYLDDVSVTASPTPTPTPTPRPHPTRRPHPTPPPRP
jgi:hypothetical protein